MFKYLVYKLGLFLVRRLSIQSAYRLALMVSDMHYALSFRDRRAVTNNLKIILNQEKVPESVVREVFRNFGRYLLEFFRLANDMDEKFVQEHVKIVNKKYLDEAVGKGKGVIFLTAHIGNWEMGGLILGMLGYPILAIALPHRERPVNDLFNRQRELKGVTVVPLRQAVHRCLAALKSNKCVAVLADRDFTNNGEVIPFLGKDVLIPKGAAIFAYKTGATILPTFMIRKENENYEIQFEPPIYPSKIITGQIERPDMVALMAQYSREIEKKIREYPEQWLLFREFWNQRLSVPPEPGEKE